MHSISIKSGGLDHPQVIAMLKFHFDTNVSVTPRGSAHVFDLSRLQAPDVQFWSAWDGDELLGVGAMKLLDAHHGEVKSMHTSKAARRRGVGLALLNHITAKAREAGLTRLSLETGSFDYFAPARALYGHAGFVECPPFEGYAPDPSSTFMTKVIGG